MAYYPNYPPGMPIPMVGLVQHPILGQPISIGDPRMWQTNVPSGLECLSQLTGVKIKQKRAGCCESGDKFLITDQQGVVLFKARANTDCCNCCGPDKINIENLNGQEIIQFRRPFACSCCCCPFGLQRLEIFSPPGQLAGTVLEEWSICQSKFMVKNADGNVVLKIEEICTFCCGNREFRLMLSDGSVPLGKISKMSTGWTSSDKFEMSFPVDLDEKMKAVMIGALLQTIYMFYQRSSNSDPQDFQ